MAHELPKTYDPGGIEPRWAEYWVAEKLFSVATPQPGSDAAQSPVFNLLLPPPNVTGILHIGHMLEHTEIDIVIRWRRMRGFLTLWLPGTDHAGIATQMMVERQLASEGGNRQTLGREGFIERVWEWKKLHGGMILKQMKRLGDSVDWDREYFTMDDNLSRCVREVFVRLYEEGLIYRGDYIVNWCPRCMTAISDLEVKHEEYAGKLYQIKYPLKDDPTQFITVATTRPETMLGDTAIAVNPKDARYTKLVGKNVVLPLMEREIPIIADDYADPQFGSGAVKITPAHDPNDFQVGLRHKLPAINVMDEQARINENGGAYQGLDRYDAREKILKDLEQRGLLAGVQDHTYAIGKCDRCKTIVEPRLSKQWFVAVKKKPEKGGGISLAEAATRAVTEGHIRITPENYRTIYLQWMENIYDWCISRQLWWGHRIPAWYCEKCGNMIVSRTDPSECSQCGSHQLRQDPDVLDTWFSSALLPFTTLGWPQATQDLKVFYPTTLLVTGFDIIFFWMARMIMMGCHFMMPPHRPCLPGDEQLSGDAALRESVPFREVYIHALVRDAERQKISKTKGNVIDPIEITEKYGTDAVRFTLASMASPGTDIAFNESRTDGYRAFANKIWNAARFVFMNLDRVEPGVRPGTAEGGCLHMGVGGFQAFALEDQWILSRFNQVAANVNDALATYRFHEAANSIYDFFWGEFCDWYLELIKPRLNFEGADKNAAKIACTNLVNLFDASLRLLHPVMPFITEEIWQAIYEEKPELKSIALAPYPQADQKQVDLAAETEMAILQDLIVSIRNLRAELKIEPKTKVPIQVYAHEPEIRTMVEHNRGAVERLANVEKITFVEHSLTKLAGSRSTARFDVHVIYERKVDVASECERLKKELERLEKGIGSGQRQLGNQQFLAKAPQTVVENLRKQQQELAVLRDKTMSKLRELGCQ